MKNCLSFSLLLITSFVLIGCNKTGAPSLQPTEPQTQTEPENKRFVAGEPIAIPVENPNENLIGGDAQAPETISGEKSFTIFGGNYYYDMKEIKVKKGDRVTINFESAEGFHDWVVDEFDVATEKVQTGGGTSVTFTADKTGSFEFYCSVGSHRANGMVGKLIVE